MYVKSIAINRVYIDIYEKPIKSARVFIVIFVTYRVLLFNIPRDFSGLWMQGGGKCNPRVGITYNVI